MREIKGFELMWNRDKFPSGTIVIVDVDGRRTEIKQTLDQHFVAMVALLNAARQGEAFIADAPSGPDDIIMLKRKELPPVA